MLSLNKIKDLGAGSLML